MNSIQIISASAGSGKTYRLTELLEQGVVKEKVRPQAVLATTFTNKAAAELQERVRIRLLEAGRTLDAQQLTAARIGTVNSICGRLVGDFAFDLGFSPELRVLDEEQAQLAMKRSISSVIAPEEETELAELSERLVDFDWQAAIDKVVVLARYNAIAPDQLKASAQRSYAEFGKLFGNPVQTAAALDAALLKALTGFIQGVKTNGDATKTTQNALERAGQAQRQLQRGQAPAWKDWVGLAKLSAGKKSEALVEQVKVAAAAQDCHPRLHSDVKRAIELVFDLAAQALNAYQEHKRELGAIDFVDQESCALRLLGRQDVREQLAGDLDLVLIDEFQDTSPIQLAIFLRLAEAVRRSVWVGDQKQAIYGFRGTDPALMDAAIAEILKDGEPDTLSTSYRSRPSLVKFTSALFAPAFALQGIPKARVTLKPVDEKDPMGLGPVIECWQLRSRNVTDDAASIAAATKALLDDQSVRVRERGGGQARPVRPGDVAILCRSNDQCLAVADQLATLGIRAVLPREGLLATLEGRAALAALRLWVDKRDTLAAAELARLIDFAGREDDWLKCILQNPGQEAFAKLPLVAAITQERQRQPNLGAVSVFDNVARSVGLLDLCRRWGDAEARLANVEALRAHVVNYATSCVTEGTGCTAAGLIAHLEELAESTTDGQGVTKDEHAVVVSTWHGAKGLEWPIVVLFPLTRRDPATRALGVSIQTNQPKPKLRDPLAGRWIRFWPEPYTARNNKMPFHDRLAEHPATAEARLQAEREDLRLLYVGWTRARDRIVLAGREGKITSDLLQLLRDVNGPLVSEPVSSTLDWAGQNIEVTIRTAEPMPPKKIAPQPSTSYVAAGPREYPPAFVQPSALSGLTAKLTKFERIGERVPITGDCDWSHLGNALHGFLCADRPGLDVQRRESLLSDLLDRWSVRSAVNVGDVLRASDSLKTWIANQWPDAQWRREWPVLYRDESGSVIRGNSDLVLKVKDGLVVIDHKSFPGSIDQALGRVAEYVGQLASYTAAIEAAMAQKVLSVWIHLPASGIVVPLPTRS
jgi:ATP-dependent exoDNAse (exonuclease V) beta subunit